MCNYVSGWILCNHADEFISPTYRHTDTTSESRNDIIRDSTSGYNGWTLCIYAITCCDSASSCHWVIRFRLVLQTTANKPGDLALRYVLLLQTTTDNDSKPMDIEW
ncbi:hypothetical protein DPMN_179919 [Dreissena polymorpha]|uniref:Uncharacterized protein n=1 Tax=Dreissena polymorpha TaxID=45954 RepID=A0A9D4IL78_DREPO|nr:hypothetical protein DPMN_179919 [Dreissena polymorpha]